MKKFLFIIFLFTFIFANATTYYVSPAGSDASSGTLLAPWKTWVYAFNNTNVDPGDTVYFRGGVYYKDINDGLDSWYYPARSLNGMGIDITRDGTAGSPIVWMAYPGETPIWDLSRMVNPVGQSTIYAFRANTCNHIRIKGLTIRNQFNNGANTTGRAWKIGGDDIVIEECIAHNIHGQGFANDESHNFTYLNCDAYLCADTLWVVSGEQGSGFSTDNSTNYNDSVWHIGCRAWLCSDQGFVTGSRGFVGHIGCLSVLNGDLDAGGHGYKAGFVSAGTDTTERQRLYQDCIAAFNRTSGWTTNDNLNPAISMLITENVAYRNGYMPSYSIADGYRVYITTSTANLQLLRVFTKNVSYDNERGDIGVFGGAVYTHEYNSWDDPPNITIADSSFISIDSAGILGPRLADGSLPVPNFLELTDWTKQQLGIIPAPPISPPGRRASVRGGKVVVRNGKLIIRD